MICPLFDMFIVVMFILFTVRFLNMCKPRATFYDRLPTWIGILWKWASMLTKLAGNGECWLAQFHAIRNFLANKISRLSHQTGCVFTWAAHFYLFQNAILHKILKLGFWILSPFLLRMQFSLVATFFCLVLVICLSWYLHLSHEFLTHLFHLTFGDKSLRVKGLHIWN